MSISFCKKDGFPMVEIEGRNQCVVEYLDYYIGRQIITDVVLRDDTLFYIFDNGHELPLYCYCCDEPLAVTDLDAYKKAKLGLRLDAMSWADVEFDDGRKEIEFFLEFLSKKEREPISVSISLKSAQKLIHPANYKKKRKPISQKKKLRKRRGRRKKR